METSFQDLGLSDGLLKTLDDAGYTTPTPIQAKAIPAVLMMRDVMGCAQTGTGKTASFTLPMIDVLAEGQGRAKMPRSLILSPTRELAAQIAQNFEKYAQNHNLKMALLIGGESMRDQGDVLNKGVDVLIATPGRMLDLFERGAIILNDVKIFVIDEADRMLDMGFIPDIETIVSKLPGSRQTLMFSATMPAEIRKLAEKFLDNPKEITVAPQSTTASTIEHRILYCGPKEKRENLRMLLEQDPPQSAIVFCNRKRDIGVLVRSLKRHGYSAGELHGDLSQPVRMDTLEKFKAGEISVLVCSDVAARGIDVASISHVFNFDVPNHAEDYVHRIGRTGRAGRNGKAFTFATKTDDKAVAAIEGIIGKKIEVVEGFGKAKEAAASKASPSTESDTPPRESAKKTSTRASGGRGGQRNRGSGNYSNDDIATHKPVPVNMGAWSDFIEDDVKRAADVFEGMIPAFLLRRKNAPELTPLDELDEEAAAQEVDTDMAGDADTQASGQAERAASGEEKPKTKPKRKRAPRKRKPKASETGEAGDASANDAEGKSGGDDAATSSRGDADTTASAPTPAIEIIAAGADNTGSGTNTAKEASTQAPGPETSEASSDAPTSEASTNTDD